MADGEVRITTKINVDEFKEDIADMVDEVKKLKAAFGNVGDNTSGIENTVDSLKNKIVSLAGQADKISGKKLLDEKQMKEVEKTLVEQSKQLVEIEKNMTSVSTASDNMGTNVEKNTTLLGKAKTFVISKFKSVKQGFDSITKSSESLTLGELNTGLSGAIGNLRKFNFLLIGSAAIANRLFKPFNRIRTAISDMAKSAAKAFGRMAKDLFGIGKATRNVAYRTERLTRRLMAIASVVVIYEGVRKALRGIFIDLKTVTMANQAFAASMNEFRAYSLIGFVQLYEQILPGLIWLFQKLAQVAAATAQIIYTFFGGTFQQAKNAAKEFENTAKGIDNVGKSAKKQTRFLARFDELLQVPADTAAAGAADIDLIDWDIKEPDFRWVDLFVEKLKSIFTVVDPEYWGGLGAKLAESIADALESIPWRNIQRAVSNLGENFGYLLNRFFTNRRLWRSIGSTIAEGLNTAVIFANRLFSKFDFSEIGHSIGDGINTFFEDTDWQLAGKTVSLIANGILLSFIGAIREVDFVKIGSSLREAFDAIEWGDLFNSLKTAIKESIGSIYDALVGFFGNKWSALFVGAGLAVITFSGIIKTMLAFVILKEIAIGIMKISGSVETLGKKLAKAFSGAILVSLASAVGAFNKLNDLSPQLTLALGFLEAALYGVGTALLLGFGPIGKVVGVIAGAIALLYRLQDKFDIFDNIITNIKAFADAIDIRLILDGLVSSFNVLMENISHIFNVVIFPIIEEFARLAYDIFVHFIIPIILVLKDTFLVAFEHVIIPLLKSLSEIFGTVFETIVGVLQLFLSFLKGTFSEANDETVSLTAVIVFLGEFVKYAFETLIIPLIQKFGEVITFVMGIVIPLIKDLAEMVMWALETVIFPLFGLLADVVGGVIDFVIGILGGLITFFKGVFTGDMDMALNGIKTLFQTIWDGIVAILTGLIPRFLKIGADLIRGLWDGINSMISWINDKIKGFASGIVEGIKGFFKIKSPSRLMEEEIGEEIGRGIAVGIDNTEKTIKNVPKEILEDTLNGLRIFIVPFKNFGVELGNAIAEGMMSTLPILQNAAQAMMDVINHTFTNNQSEIILGFKSLLNGLLSQFETFANSVLTSLHSFARQIISELNFVVMQTGGRPYPMPPRPTQIVVPRLAKGGFLQSSTIAQLAENGKKEVVIPLERDGRWADMLSERLANRIAEKLEGIGGGETIIRFEGNLSQLGRVLKPVIEKEERRAGKRIGNSHKQFVM